MITVVGLGPGCYDLLTLRAARILESAPQVFLRTAQHPTVVSLPESVRWVAFDDVYKQAPDFEAVYDTIVARLLELAAKGEAVVYAVPGDPSLGEATVRRLIERAASERQEVRLIPGVSFLSAALAAGPGSASGHLQIMDALAPVELNPLLPAVVYQLHDRRVASSVKLELLRLYPPDHRVSVVQGGDASQTARGLALAELDRKMDFDHLTSLYVPPLAPERAISSPFGLRAIVHRLRAPGGCPWDRAQTPASLVRYVLEEAYEVADAIREGDPHGLREELGDLLLQVYLQAEIAEESGDFDLTNVIRGISEKLISRHPHVFAGVEVANAEEVERNWERLKQAEKGEAPSALDAIPRSMPALARAQEIQRKLSKANFEFPDRKGVLGKLDEELAEIREAVGDAQRLESELGDVLFMLAKLATDAGLDAEAALRGTIQRVISRYRYVERCAAQRGSSVSALGLDTLIELWEQAKETERSGNPS